MIDKGFEFEADFVFNFLLTVRWVLFSLVRFKDYSDKINEISYLRRINEIFVWFLSVERNSESSSLAELWLDTNLSVQLLYDILADVESETVAALVVHQTLLFLRTEKGWKKCIKVLFGNTNPRVGDFDW